MTHFKKPSEYVGLNKSILGRWLIFFVRRWGRGGLEHDV